MRNASIVWAVILTLSPAAHATHLRIQEGRPIVDGIFVNGHGPYRFLLDTGANVNLIEKHLASSIGLTATVQMDLQSAAGMASIPASDGNEITLGSAKAQAQRFLVSPLEAVRRFSPDIQGVLGQWFLSQFDYAIDLEKKELNFGVESSQGTHVPIEMMNGRLAISTSLGKLILDSGVGQPVLFGVEPDIYLKRPREWQTLTGAQQVGMVFRKPFVIDGQVFWRGDAIAIPVRPEVGIDGLLPIALFRRIYVCNSEGYVVLE